MRWFEQRAIWAANGVVILVDRYRIRGGRS